MKKFFLILSILLISGCANPYSKSYVDYSGKYSPTNAVYSKEEPQIIVTTDMDKEITKMGENGFAMAGVSSIEGSNDNLQEAREQAKKVGAFFVVVQNYKVKTVATYWIKVKGYILGVFAKELNPAEKADYGIDGGVVIKSVIKGSQAEKAGLKKDDIIIRMGEDDITDGKSYMEALRKYQTKKVKVHFLRNFVEKTVTVKLNKAP